MLFRSKNVPFVAPAIAPMAPIQENRELVSCDIVCESSSSIITMSEEKRLRIRPKIMEEIKGIR